MNHRPGADLPAPSSAGQDGREPLTLETFLPYRLSVAANLVSSAIARHYQADFGLSIPEWRVMAVLAQHSGLSAADVTQRTAMDKVRVSRAVTGLIGDGRLMRTVDPEDRRRSILALTDAGWAVYWRILPVARSYEARLLAGLDVREREQLDRLLTRLVDLASDL